jgi:hypothetical protein
VLEQTRLDKESMTLNRSGGLEVVGSSPTAPGHQHRRTREQLRGKRRDTESQRLGSFFGHTAFSVSWANAGNAGCRWKRKNNLHLFT